MVTVSEVFAEEIKIFLIYFILRRLVYQHILSNFLNAKWYYFLNLVFDRDLDADLKKEGLGLLGRILRSITTGGREVSTAVSFSRTNKELAKQEAQELYDVYF